MGEYFKYNQNNHSMERLLVTYTLGAMYWELCIVHCCIENIALPATQLAVDQLFRYAFVLAVSVCFHKAAVVNI